MFRPSLSRVCRETESRKLQQGALNKPEPESFFQLSVSVQRLPPTGWAVFTSPSVILVGPYFRIRAFTPLAGQFMPSYPGRVLTMLDGLISQLLPPLWAYNKVFFLPPPGTASSGFGHKKSPRGRIACDADHGGRRTSCSSPFSSGTPSSGFNKNLSKFLLHLHSNRLYSLPYPREHTLAPSIFC